MGKVLPGTGLASLDGEDPDRYFSPALPIRQTASQLPPRLTQTGALAAASGARPLPYNHAQPLGSGPRSPHVPQAPLSPFGSHRMISSNDRPGTNYASLGGS